MVFFCVDIGGTNTLIGMGNGDFEVKKKLKSREFLDSPEERLEDMLEKEGYTHEEVSELAVAVAGPMDEEKRIFYPPNMGKDEVDLSCLENLGEMLVVNDCTSAVLGEYFYGNHDSENLVYVTISSGIGAGVFTDGEVDLGMNGNFGEVGHMIVGTGLECGCGGTGHWEAYCSGENLPNMAGELFDLEVDSAREVFDLADQGDEKASEVIRKFQEVNAVAFSNIVNLYNPEKILLGGAVSLNHPDKVFSSEKDLDVVNEVPEIEVCALEEEAVIHGLRAVCNDRYEP
jgi:glucokinase